MEGVGEFPPIIIAALRQKMVALAGEISQGVVFANAARSHMAASLAALPAAKRNDADFFIGNMLPTCISDDVEAAKAVCRKNLIHYAFLPNYRNYWKEAGYVEEMTEIERAIAEGRRDDVPRYLTDRWLADVSVFGSASRVRDGVEAWQACRRAHTGDCAVIDVGRSAQGAGGDLRDVRLTTVIARSEATKQSPSNCARTARWRLLRRCAPRNDSFTQHRAASCPADRPARRTARSRQ